MSHSWSKYYERTRAQKPSKFLIDAIESFAPQPGRAIDLGCGAGRDTRYLLEMGFSVTALDKDPAAEKYLTLLPHQDNLQFVCMGFEDFNFARYDVINAHYALPFAGKEHFARVMNDVMRALNPNGLFVGQLFGVDDEWNTPEAKTAFCDRADLDKLFHDFQDLKITEVNEKGTMASGNEKHWHVFNIIAQK